MSKYKYTNQLSSQYRQIFKSYHSLHKYTYSAMPQMNKGRSTQDFSCQESFMKYHLGFSIRNNLNRRNIASNRSNSKVSCQYTTDPILEQPLESRSYSSEIYSRSSKFLSAKPLVLRSFNKNFYREGKNSLSHENIYKGKRAYTQPAELQPKNQHEQYIQQNNSFQGVNNEFLQTKYINPATNSSFGCRQKGKRYDKQANENIKNRGSTENVDAKWSQSMNSKQDRKCQSRKQYRWNNAQLKGKLTQISKKRNQLKLRVRVHDIWKINKRYNYLEEATQQSNDQQEPTKQKIRVKTQYQNDNQNLKLSQFKLDKRLQFLNERQIKLQENNKREPLSELRRQKNLQNEKQFRSRPLQRERYRKPMQFSLKRKKDLENIAKEEQFVKTPHFSQTQTEQQFMQVQKRLQQLAKNTFTDRY